MPVVELLNGSKGTLTQKKKVVEDEDQDPELDEILGR
jgi:hypothetical protein